MPGCLHFGSILPQVWLHFGIIFRFIVWRSSWCVFFWFLVSFLTHWTFHLDALACTPCYFSSFRKVATIIKTYPNYLQICSQNQPQINPDRAQIRPNQLHIGPNRAQIQSNPSMLIKKLRGICLWRPFSCSSSKTCQKKRKTKFRDRILFTEKICSASKNETSGIVWNAFWQSFAPIQALFEG